MGGKFNGQKIGDIKKSVAKSDYASHNTSTETKHEESKMDTTYQVKAENADKMSTSAKTESEHKAAASAQWDALMEANKTFGEGSSQAEGHKAKYKEHVTTLRNALPKFTEKHEFNEKMYGSGPDLAPGNSEEDESRKFHSNNGTAPQAVTEGSQKQIEYATKIRDAVAKYWEDAAARVLALSNEDISPELRPLFSEISSFLKAGAESLPQEKNAPKILDSNVSGHQWEAPLTQFKQKFKDVLGEKEGYYMFKDFVSLVSGQ